MKKLIKFVMPALCVVPMLAQAEGNNAPSAKDIVLSVGATYQPIEKATKLKKGSSEQYAIKLLGRPIHSQTKGQGKALQWCKTGAENTLSPYDEFLIGFFYKGKLVGTGGYLNKTKPGDCAKLYQQVEWKPANKLTEYKVK
ncbi:hypothetical protein [Avibacterium sp. 21-594]|uniref:hypothetical protein n=1 Tax=Avibacterium sp. 21-594 TaxID=2911535 RepID=UPI00224862EF|nr:hypothetical protein [Avibacterium sp. 21-594]MCW9716400.1 hypothetical protein [Avibacterium sp. 21-594]